MRFTSLFGKTLREAPADSGTASHRLAMRAALARPVENGIAYLPLGWRVQQKLANAFAKSLEALGAQPMFAPHESGFDRAYAREIASYRDLPKLTYSVQTNPNPQRAATGNGLLSLRGQHTISGFAFTPGAAHSHFTNLQHCLGGVAQSFGLEVLVAQSADGVEFHVANEHGGDSLWQCEQCDYRATPTAARFALDPCANSGDAPAQLEKVATPNCNTIAALAAFLELPKCQTLKAVLYTYNDSELVFVVIRGDLDVNPVKIARWLGGGRLRAATEAEIVAARAVPGYASPRGLAVAKDAPSRSPKTVTVLADASIRAGANFAAGANEPGYHFVNVNYPRDFAVTIIEDFAMPFDGVPCAVCGGRLREARTLWLGGVASGESPATYLDSSGRPQPLGALTFRVELDRLMAAIIEANHDEAGILWPPAAAPFDAHLVRLGKAPETALAADEAYAQLTSAGVSVLYDDRDDSAGVKFADADLLGIPIRITVSDKSLKAGGAEVKPRHAADRQIVPLNALQNAIRISPPGG